MRAWIGLVCLLPGLAAAEGIAIQAGKVHTVSEAGVLTDATILVLDGVVQAVGSGLPVPPGYAVVDATNAVVTPGLVAPYTRFGIEEIELEASTRDDAVVAYPLGPALDVADAFDDSSTLYAVNRRDGVTRAVVAPRPGNDPLAGWGALIRLSEREQLFDTRIAMFGTLATNEFTGGSTAAVIHRLREGLANAKRRAQRSTDTREYRYADSEALHALQQSGAPLVLEVHRAADIRRAVELAEIFSLRLIILGGSEAWKVADVLAAADVPLIIDGFANRPSGFDRLGARSDNAALLHAAGVRVSFTSGETQNARWIRQIAGNAVAEGMPWDAALAAITVQPALTFGFPNGVGQIVEGGVADLVLWTGDPLEVTTWAEQVMIDGVWQPMHSRQTRLYERYRSLDAEGLPYGYR